MALTGDFAALAAFYTKLRKFSDTGRQIAQELAPKVEALVGETFAGQHGPNGETWPPTVSGAPAFGGGDAGGRVLSRLVGKSTVRTTVLYPLHFHQEGTHAGGRKTQRKVRVKLKKEGYSKAGIKGVLAQLEAGRKAGAWHDPPRPMIPDEGEPVPPAWTQEIIETVRPILAEIGAT